MHDDDGVQVQCEDVQQRRRVFLKAGKHGMSLNDVFKRHWWLVQRHNGEVAGPTFPSIGQQQRKIICAQHVSMTL